MKAEYMLPVKVKIEAKNPDAFVVGIARAMYDAATVYMSVNEAEKVDVEYTIYKKPNADTFGQE